MMKLTFKLSLTLRKAVAHIPILVNLNFKF